MLTIPSSKTFEEGPYTIIVSGDVDAQSVSVNVVRTSSGKPAATVTLWPLEAVGEESGIGALVSELLHLVSKLGLSSGLFSKIIQYVAGAALHFHLSGPSSSSSSGPGAIPFSRPSPTSALITPPPAAAGSPRLGGWIEE